MAGFASGLAEGLGQGINLAGQQAARELQARQEAVREQNYQSEIAHRTALESAAQANLQRQQGLDTYKALGDQYKDLLAQRGADTGNADEYDRQLAQIREQQHAALASQLGPQLQGRQKAADTFTGMANGQTTYDKADPGDLYGSFSHALGFGAEKLVDPNSAESKAVAYLSGPSSNFSKDSGAQALTAINTLEQPRLHGFLGDTLADGSKVVHAEFVAPQPTDSGQFVPMIRFVGQTEDGRQTEQILPAIAGDQKAADPLHVHLANVGDALGRYHSMGALATILQNTPLGQKVKDAAGDHGDRVGAELDAYHVANANPNQLHAGPAQAPQQGLAPVDFTKPITSEEELAAAKKQLSRYYKGGFVEERDATGKLLNAVLGPKAQVIRTSYDPEKRALEMQNLRSEMAARGTQIVQATDPDTGKPMLVSVNRATNQTTKLGLEPVAKGAGGTSAAQANAMSDDAIDLAAQYFMQNGKMPPGFARNVAAEARVFDRVSNLNKAVGNDNEAAVNEALANSARGKAVTDLQKRNTLLQGSEKTALKNLDVLDNATTKLDRTGSPLVNKLTQAMQTSVVQDADLAAAKTALITFANEYARVVTGQTTGAAVTDAARKEQEQLLSLTDSPEAFKARIKVMKQDMANRTSAYDDELKATRDAMKQPESGLAGSAEGKAAGVPAGQLSVYDASGKLVGHVKPENKGTLPAGYTAR